MIPENRDTAELSIAEEVPRTDVEGSSDDDSLIRWMLARTPTERLSAAQGFVDSLIALSRARAD